MLCVYTEDVGGSTPSSPTMKTPIKSTRTILSKSAYRKLVAVQRDQYDNRLVSSAVSLIFSRCVVDEATGCLNWSGASGYRGYGRIRALGRLRLPHRIVAYAHGVVDALDVIHPADYVLHRCDNPKCCNPSHMRRGTLSENMRDCATKGRLRQQVATP